MDHEGLIQTILLGSGSLIDNPYRLGSTEWGKFVREARELYHAGELDDLDEDSYHLLESDAGVLADYQGSLVMLEVPAENFEKPGWMYVYVYGEDGDILKLEFEFEGVTGPGDVTFD